MQQPFDNIFEFSQNTSLKLVSRLKGKSFRYGRDDTSTSLAIVFSEQFARSHCEIYYSLNSASSIPERTISLCNKQYLNSFETQLCEISYTSIILSTPLHRSQNALFPFAIINIPVISKYNFAKSLILRLFSQLYFIYLERTNSSIDLAITLKPFVEIS